MTVSRVGQSYPKSARSERQHPPVLAPKPSRGAPSMTFLDPGVRTLRSVRDDTGLSHLAIAVHAALCSQHRDGSGRVQISQDRLGRLVNRGVKQVGQALDLLDQAGWIAIRSPRPNKAATYLLRALPGGANRFDVVPYELMDALAAGQASPAVLVTWMHYHQAMGREGRTRDPLIKIAQACGLRQTKTIEHHLALLEGLGLVLVERRRGGQWGVYRPGVGCPITRTSQAVPVQHRASVGDRDLGGHKDPDHEGIPGRTMNDVREEDVLAQDLFDIDQRRSQGIEVRQRTVEELLLGQRGDDAFGGLVDHGIATIGQVPSSDNARTRATHLGDGLGLCSETVEIEQTPPPEGRCVHSSLGEHPGERATHLTRELQSGNRAGVARVLTGRALPDVLDDGLTDIAGNLITDLEHESMIIRSVPTRDWNETTRPTGTKPPLPKELLAPEDLAPENPSSPRSGDRPVSDARAPATSGLRPKKRFARPTGGVHATAGVSEVLDQLGPDWTTGPARRWANGIASSIATQLAAGMTPGAAAGALIDLGDGFLEDSGGRHVVAARQALKTRAAEIRWGLACTGCGRHQDEHDGVHLEHSLCGACRDEAGIVDEIPTEVLEAVYAHFGLTWASA